MPTTSEQGRDRARHPHFEENRIAWKDEYSGMYPAPPEGFSHQFELQWKLALGGDREYYEHPGASVEEEDVHDRVYEWTGVHPTGKRPWLRRNLRPLDEPIARELIEGRACIDIGCGMGRWTRVMQALGAESVLSIDASESAIASVSRFNRESFLANIMEIPGEHPEWVGRFDFACFWGVAMCTNDPLKAFLSASSTVREGGSLYLMVYSPTGMHNTELTNTQRRKFHSLKELDARLAYVEHVSHFAWDPDYPLRDNLRNQLIRGARAVMPWLGGGRMGYLDLLEPYYNWVIPMEVIEGWTQKGGFRQLRSLCRKPRSAYHLLLTK